MKIIVTESMFRDAFQRAGRADQFSYEGLGMLFEYLTGLEEDCNEEFELDVVDICCTYSEWSPEQAVNEEYLDTDDDMDEDDIRELVMKHMEERTTIIGTTKAGDILFADY